MVECYERDYVLVVEFVDEFVVVCYFCCVNEVLFVWEDLRLGDRELVCV